MSHHIIIVRMTYYSIDIYQISLMITYFMPNIIMYNIHVYMSYNTTQLIKTSI